MSLYCPRCDDDTIDFESGICSCGYENPTRITELEAKLSEANQEIERLRLRLLSAAGDDLCRLSQEEIKAYTSGAVQIPPKEEFLPSCERFHEQIANGAGVLNGCLTLAQLIAENEKLRRELEASK